MTDQERFEEWSKIHYAECKRLGGGYISPEYAMGCSNGFLAALAIGREEGRKERTEIDYRRMCDKITEVVAQGLHYTENMEKIHNTTAPGVLPTAAEINKAIHGGIDRYRNDYIYHAKVQAFVAQLLQEITKCFEKGESDV